MRYLYFIARNMDEFVMCHKNNKSNNKNNNDNFLTRILIFRQSTFNLAEGTYSSSIRTLKMGPGARLTWLN